MKKKYAVPLGLAATFLTVGLIGTSSFTTAFARVPEQALRSANFAKMPHSGYLAMFKNVVHKVEMITNGVKITMTSTDAAFVTKLQTMAAPVQKEDAKVTVTQTNISNGVEITMTSTDAETVKKLQAGSQFQHKMDGKQILGKKGTGKLRPFVKKLSR